jgi:DNA-directed RNA polymerase III subunit RPC3
VSAPPEPKRKSRKRSYESDNENERRTNGHKEKIGGKGKHRVKVGSEDDDGDLTDPEELFDEDEIDAESRRRGKRMELLKQHMEILAEDSWKFVRLESNRGMGEWSVNYKELGKLLRQIELEKVVDETFGEMGLRLLRILKDKGKLEEKQVRPILWPLCFFCFFFYSWEFQTHGF